MTWIKKGLVYSTNGAHAWSRTHAQVPVADLMSDRIRIYYASRNDTGQSNTSFIEVSRENPSDILYTHGSPILKFGKPGSFDDCGIMPTCMVTVGPQKFLYYIGWTLKKTVPYQNAVGLAISDDGISFTKVSEGPIITVNRFEPYFSGTAYVMKTDKVFRMYYLSCIGWQSFDNKMEPLYDLKYAESHNGIDWIQSGRTAIPLRPHEGGIASAAVIFENGIYKMWFSKRGRESYRTNTEEAYRIGFATSANGIDWERADNLAGIDVSEDGWDSEMIAYPYIIQYDGMKVMFYNGNGFGRSGFGYAILEN